MVSRMVVALGLSAVEHSIQSMTATLMAAKPTHIRLYRLGHARFGFVHLGDIEPARALALRFTSCFDQPLDIGNAFPIALSAHAGIARIDDDAAAADVMGALFAVSEQARAANRTLLMYDKAIQAAQQRAFAIGNSMRAALAAEDQLRLVYQPRERLSDGAWVAAEALIRWHHPQLGELAPGEFVPLIETTSLMPKLTDWVIEHAVAQLAAWNRSAPWFRISINIAASDFGRADLVDMLCAALARHRADASNLEIEITETAIAADPEHAHAMLRKLREIGIVVAIDDFGSGYSSLARWQTFSFDILKIDRTLIRDAIENERANAVFQWVASLAKKLGQRVVVEGIENAAQRNAAAHWGCDEAQGFLISHPLEAASMTARLAARRNRSIDDLPIERSARAMRREWVGTRQIHGSVSPDSITARLMNLRRTISAYLRPR
jgi:EAL domain-containing protein (putative c-di-GMP-specific phosphodiesterase class I)